MAIKTAIRVKLEQLFTKQTEKIVKKYNPKVVAVVGSVGKTSTKLAIATVLKQKYRVQHQDGNYNVQLSVPFIFLGRKYPNIYNPLDWFGAWVHGQRVLKNGLNFDVVVVELGTDHPGEIAQFKEFLHPDITVVTAISEEHMEYFDSVDAVAKEELSIAEFTNTLLVSTDDINEAYIEKYIPRGTVIHSYGFSHAEYKLNATKAKPIGFTLEVTLGDGEVVSVQSSVIAEHSLKATGAAIAVADLLDMSPAEIIAGVGQISPVPGRMQVLKGINNSLIIDDTYNASPIACRAALDAIYAVDSPQRIAMLGMMNELGAVSRQAHTDIGNYCDPSKLDLVVTVGADANKYLAKAAEARGCNVQKVNSPMAAGKLVKSKIRDGAVVLAKGSQNGVFAEEAVKQLLQNGEDAYMLVRQSDSWMAKKRKQFADIT